MIIRNDSTRAAVRTGDLSQFQSALVAHTAQFTADSIYKLILRLRHNVIKTGVRSLSLAYSLISLRDICVKLHLDSEEDAEYIVGKAVRDGVIEARVDHANGWMVSLHPGSKGFGADEVGGEGVYATTEPREVFTKRIGFCLELHNESVKASHRPSLSRTETPSFSYFFYSCPPIRGIWKRIVALRYEKFCSFRSAYVERWCFLNRKMATSVLACNLTPDSHTLGFFEKA